jgi:hypothetical protein
MQRGSRNPKAVKEPCHSFDVPQLAPSGEKELVSELDPEDQKEWMTDVREDPLRCEVVPPDRKIEHGNASSICGRPKKPTPSWFVTVSWRLQGMNERRHHLTEP